MNLVQTRKRRASVWSSSNRFNARGARKSGACVLFMLRTRCICWRAKSVPGNAFYDGFPQYANGVGTIRSFLDDVTKLKRRRVRDGPRTEDHDGDRRSGRARFARIGRQVLRDKNLADAQVLEVHNTYWGGNVACAGLIMGQELVAQSQRSRFGRDAVFAARRRGWASAECWMILRSTR